MARVLRAFEPVLEAFEAVEEGGSELTLATEQEQKFNSNYQALYRQVSGNLSYRRIIKVFKLVKSRSNI